MALAFGAFKGILIQCLIITTFFWCCRISTAEKDKTLQYYEYQCPKNFKNVGRKCYHFSNTTATWFQAFFSCKDFLASNLTVFTERYDQKQLEHYLFRKKIKNRAFHLNSLWVGGFKDWKKKKWIYHDGSLIKFPTLKEVHLSELDNWTCLLIDGNKKQWKAENCMTKHSYICEAPVTATILRKIVQTDGKRRVTIDDCVSNHHLLTRRQQQRCLRLLDGNGKKLNRHVSQIEPAALGRKPEAITRSTITHICPQNWMSIGNQCYLFSKEKATWADAHFNCEQINAKLAVVKSKVQDQKLRIFLNGFTEKQERWLGARYNSKRKKWIWALNGKALKYNGFEENVAKNQSETLDWQAVVMDPQYAYRWSHRNEMEKCLYICQVKGKAVKRLNYQKKSLYRRSSRV